MRVIVSVKDVTRLDTVVRLVERLGGSVLWISEVGRVVVVELPETLSLESFRRVVESRVPGAKVMPDFTVLHQALFFR